MSRAEYSSSTPAGFDSDGSADRRSSLNRHPNGQHRSADASKRSRRISHNQAPNRYSPSTNGGLIPSASFSQSSTGSHNHASVPRLNGTKSCSPRESPTSAGYFSGAKFMTAPPASSLPAPPIHWLKAPQHEMDAPKVVVLDSVLAKLFGVAALTTPAACAQEVRSLCEALPTKAKSTPTKA